MNQLPDYVIANNRQYPILNLHYQPIQEWLKPDRVFGMRFKNESSSTGNEDILIFKKI
jgi:hypothetical protein